MRRRTHDKLISDLKEKLHIAIELEHSTLPPYLYAYWSVKDHNSHAATAILDVAKEEMNHMAMACNMLNAVGGFVNCANKNFIPDYPTGLPGHEKTADNFEVSLGKLSIDSIVSFLQIELPRDPTDNDDNSQGWSTIADFYLDVLADINECTDDDFSHGRQLNPTDSPSESGILFAVRSKKQAKLCIAEIIEQGEGLRPNKEQAPILNKLNLVTHFERFYQVYQDMGGMAEVDIENFNAEELKSNVDPEQYEEFMKGVHNMLPNPGQSEISNELFHRENLKFNSIYSHMLDGMHTHKSRRHPDMSAAIKSMFALGRHAAALRSIALEDNMCGGPSFEYIARPDRL